MSLFHCSAADEAAVRGPAVAGQFYTANPAELRKEVEEYVAAGKQLDRAPRIIICPHAGYVFSGPVAGIGFATIDPNTERVILIGPSHRKAFAGISIPDVKSYRTPLGDVPLARARIEKLRACKFVHCHPDAHALEHCLEVELPFLQVLLGDFAIVPIIVGRVAPEDVADLLLPLLDARTLLVASSDFSHYLSHEDARKTDDRSIETILRGDVTGFVDACGEVPIRVAMHLAKRLNLAPGLLDARDSYETAPQHGGPGRVVGYASIVFVEQEQDREFGEADKDFLLKLARDALNRAVKEEPPPSPREIPAAAKEVRGCFVTLTKGGSLRGCIGYIEGVKPLYQAAIDMAGNAALNDRRFPRVSPDELDDIKVEVSVLTRPESLTYTDPENLLGQLVPLRDGIILKKGHHQAVFLPQVWKQLPDKVEFLQHLSRKAGLGSDEWRDAEYHRYRAVHFQEE